MNNKNLLPIVIALLVFGGIYFFARSSTTPEVTTEETTEVENTGDSAAEEPGTDEAMDSEDAMEKTGATYVDYSPDAIAQATADGKRPVLFFHASWCPTCKALENDLQAGGLDQLPEDVVVIKTDYDSATELRQQYGVTLQHTLVQVDADGNEVAKWSGGGVETIIDRIV